MTRATKDPRSTVDKARGTVGITGRIEHEDYIPHPENGDRAINASRGMT